MAGAPTSGDVWLQRIFHYMPAMGPAAAFSFLYILVIGWSSWQTDKARRRDSRRRCCRCQEGFMLILPIVAAVEFLGYSMRVACITNKTLAFYVQQQFFLLVAPIALAILNYKVAGHLLVAAGKKLILPAPWITKFFLGVDIVCFVLQAGAGGLLAVGITDSGNGDIAGGRAKISQGQNLMDAGLALQLALNAVFTIMIAATCCMKEFRSGTSPVPKIKTVWAVVWSTLMLMWVRNIYRTVESKYKYTDPNSYVATNEWLLYVFESAPIFLCCVIFTYWHLGLIMPEHDELHALFGRPIVKDIADQEASGASKMTSEGQHMMISVQPVVPNGSTSAGVPASAVLVVQQPNMGAAAQYQTYQQH